MNFTSRFGLGDRVFTITRGSLYKDEPCTICSETGKISVSGEEFVCPKCKGRKLEQRTAYRWYRGESFVVRNIQVRFDDTDGPWIGFSYMAATSGSVWSGNHLFASAEEATAACDRLNEVGIAAIDHDQRLTDGVEREPLAEAFAESEDA